MKACFTSWKMWAGIAAVFALLLFFKSGSLTGILPFAVFLICPLMMLFMMGGHNGHCDHKETKEKK